MQFRGVELFKKEGALIQEEFYLPKFFRPPLTNWWYLFFKVFVCWWNLTTRPWLTAIFLSLPNSVCIAMCDWLRALVHLYCDEPQRMICWELSNTCIVTLWLGHKQSKHGDVTNLSRATCHVWRRKFGTKVQSATWMWRKACQFKEEGLKFLGR